MSTLAEIEAAADLLPRAELERLFHHLEQKLNQKLAEHDPNLVQPGQRVAGLHAGAWEVAADFDDPLPDEFWLGKDA